MEKSRPFFLSLSFFTPRCPVSPSAVFSSPPQVVCSCTYPSCRSLLVPSLHAYELFMAMMHTAPAETADAAVQVATMAHTSLVNNPTYNLVLNGIGVGTVASTILIKFWIYAVLLSPPFSPLVVESTGQEVRQQRSLRERAASPSRRVVLHRGARRTLRPRIQ